MKLSELMSRLTGISTPIGGVSWTSPEPDVAVARRVLVFLEDRRVLYAPYDLEIPRSCVESVFEIRRFLTRELDGAVGDNLAGTLRAMRAACRKFLTETDPRTANWDREWDWPSRGRRGLGSSFDQALGELRGVFGVHIATLAARHGLDVPEALDATLPAADAESAQPDEGDEPCLPEW